MPAVNGLSRNTLVFLLELVQDTGFSRAVAARQCYFLFSVSFTTASRCFT